MKNILKIVSFAGLVLSIVPPVLLFLGKLEMDPMKLWMGVGMVAWMVTAPFWINKSSQQSQ
ncbi:hypothetical protein J0A67_20545 [Algoriphagus aestuariicola]|jgi:hypothetical protein|uniref:Uncharacterized protein n=1 Tax=Algoriphagus aestuariicola TaxID=1852016 RepID=A0ABS3BVH7_9BACT|nr:hypothetical protein [Algoriphagus aestuariicola]MBN7803277.1 hypothetical protein [Algoriphagus aestuariicola]